MKTLLLYLSILISQITYATTYNITYFTTDDQNTVREAVVEITPNGDNFNLIIKRNDGLILVKTTAKLNGEYIRIIGDNKISGGYLYKHISKLRGNIFLNVETGMLVIIVREI